MCCGLLFVREWTPVLLGLTVGMVAALALGRLLTTQLYQVSPHNPALLATTALTLGAVALACMLPARAPRNIVNPIEALRALNDTNGFCVRYPATFQESGIQL